MPFDAYLLNLPDWLLMILLILFFSSFSIAGLLITRKFIHHSILKLHNDVAGFMFSTLGVIYAVLLAFVVLVVWEEYNDAKKIAESEGSYAFALYRDVSLYPDSTIALKLRREFKDYAKAVIHKEYPAMKEMKVDTKTIVMFRDFFYEMKKINPQTAQEQIIYSEIMDNLNTIAEYRALRMLNSKSSVPSAVWIAIIIGGLITIGFTFLFGTENFKAQMFMSICLSTLVALVIFVIIELQYPFSGEVSVGSEGYKEILEWSPLENSDTEIRSVINKDN